MNNYSFNEVYKETLKYFNGDDLATNTWIKKYALCDKEGRYLELTPDDMHHRMAKYFAKIEEKYQYQTNYDNSLKLSHYGYSRQPLSEERIYNLFKNFKYVIPAGSVMSGLGNNAPVSLSNCWVIDGPNDSLESIFKVCNEQSQLMKRRGGVGFDISKLRPSGAYVNNSAKSSTGAVSFMDLFSNVTNTIAQNGRRGALMLSISVKHPDAEDFIEKKQDLTKVTGANISVKITDEFMQAVINDKDYIQLYPISEKIENVLSSYSKENIEYNKLYKGEKQGTYYKVVKAKELWNKLIYCAWNTAEPGIIFEDMHLNYSPDSVYDNLRGTSTNPCGEIFMHEDSCRLINIQLSSFIENEFSDNAKLNEDLLYKVGYETTLLADDLVDLEEEAIKRIMKKIENDGDKGNSEYQLYERLLHNSLQGRRCGIGINGLSDTIAKLNLKYDSDKSLNMIQHIMKILFIAEMDAEIDMSILRGSFLCYNKDKESKGNPWYNRFKEEFPELYTKMFRYGRRNASWSTCPPCGTVALMAQSSSGIEPLFSPYYKRRVKCMKPSDRVDYIDNLGVKFSEYMVVHPALLKWAIQKYGEEAKNYNEEKWNEIYKISPWYKSTANDIDWEKRVELQGIINRYVTHSISSTINLPNSVTKEEVSTIYMSSWKDGLKGITVYRDGCRSGVLVTNTKKEEKQENKVCISNEVKKRPKSLDCKIYRFNNKGERWVGVIGMLDGKPYEIFTGLLDKLNIPDWVEDGNIVKNYENIIDPETQKEVRKSRYDICYIDKDESKVCVNGLSQIFRAEYWNYAKLISGLLRHNMPIQYIIKVISSLNLDESNINTWKNGVIRLLRKFVKDNGEELDEKCPDCGGRLVRISGCIQCIDCGYSRCS